jgi:serine/threonine protein kinase
VLDFGLAKKDPPSAAAGSLAPTEEMLTTPGAVIGTAAYMSSEQARGLAVDARTDRWSVGIVFYEILTEERPFQGATTAVIFDSVLNHASAPCGRTIWKFLKGWSGLS